MKTIKTFALLLIFLLSILSSSTFAEAPNKADIIDDIRNMPYEHRMEFIEDIMQMVADMNGLEALEDVFNSVRSAYPVSDIAKQPFTTKEELSEETLSQLLSAQPLTITKTELLIDSSDWNALFPDMLSAILTNNSDDDIQNALVAFVAWDKNGLPVKIEGQFDFFGGEYLKRVSYDDINLIPGASFGKNKGYSLTENHTITSLKAIAVSYETFEGETWENPYFDTFRNFYEGKKLSAS